MPAGTERKGRSVGNGRRTGAARRPRNLREIAWNGRCARRGSHPSVLGPGRVGKTRVAPPGRPRISETIDTAPALVVVERRQDAARLPGEIPSPVPGRGVAPIPPPARPRRAARMNRPGVAGSGGRLHAYRIAGPDEAQARPHRASFAVDRGGLSARRLRREPGRPRPMPARDDGPTRAP